MAQYMLLFYDNPAKFQDMSPAEMQRIVERYKAWTEKLRDRGHYVDSHKLRDEGGRVVRRQENRVRVIDGPFTEAKEVLGGYITIEAADYDQALERLQDCPHLDYGTVIIREIEPV
jgi:hypothetical protein